MVSTKLILALALLGALIPAHTYAAPSSETPVTDIEASTDNGDYGDDGDYGGDDDWNWPWGIFPSFGFRSGIWDFLNSIFSFKREQLYDNLKTFDTESCSQTDKNAPCSFNAYISFNGNCTIYTVGNCDNNSKSDENCVHKCKLPITSPAGTGSSPAPIGGGDSSTAALGDSSTPAPAA